MSRLQFRNWMEMFRFSLSSQTLEQQQQQIQYTYIWNLLFFKTPRCQLLFLRFNFVYMLRWAYNRPICRCIIPVHSLIAFVVAFYNDLRKAVHKCVSSKPCHKDQKKRRQQTQKTVRKHTKAVKIYVRKKAIIRTIRRQLS